jgi:glycosyltransferase involved in cell wall biosynthesis
VLRIGCAARLGVFERLCQAMNIVLVSKECPPSPRSSGIGTYILETGRGLAHLGNRVTILAAADDGLLTSSTPVPRLTVVRLPDDEMDVWNRNIGARTFCAPLKQGEAYRRRIAEYVGTLTNDQRPDIIEFPGYRGESIAWLEGPRLFPMVARMHGFTAGIDGVWKDHVSASRRLQVKWESQEFRAADVITAVSEQQGSLVRARFGDKRVQVVHNSIDAALWRKLSSSAPEGLEGNDILFAGSLVKKKGIFTLLKAANLLRQNGWRGRLVLAGRTTSQFERFTRLQTALGRGLPDWVVRLGNCPRERLAGLYRDAGACCFPSLLEPLGYTSLEAMACGGLVIGSLRTGMAEMLDHTCGFLAPPGDVAGLAAALRSALSMNIEERTRMKQAAQERVRDAFDHGVILPKLLGVYSEAIYSYGNRSAPAPDLSSVHV